MYPLFFRDLPEPRLLFDVEAMVEDGPGAVLLPGVTYFASACAWRSLSCRQPFSASL